MIKVVLSTAMAIHGIIHLIGFVREWNLSPLGKFTTKTLIHFSGNTSKSIGILWLIACVLFLASAFGYYSRKDWFCVMGATGLIISQTLIIIYWQDAKWGTGINVMLLIVVIFSTARIGFNKMVQNEVTTLIGSSSSDKSVITEEKVSVLPEIIQTWLRKSNVIGKPVPKGVHIIQKGSMRTDPNSNWMPFDAEQYFTIYPPGFVWNASIHTGSSIDIIGRDKYENGKGNMLIKAAYLIPMANSSGREIDQGTMIRFMAEMMWFPQVAISKYLDWEQLDERHALVTMSYADVTASGIYTFNDDGFPIGFEAQRYGEFEGIYKMEKWSVAVKSYQNFNGITIGNESEVTWKLKEGDFAWLKLKVTDIAYK